MDQTLYDRTCARIRSEAVGWASEARERFNARIRQADSFITDKTDRMLKVTALDMFIEASVGLLVSLVTSYANSLPETEELVVKGIRKRFDTVREAQKRASTD